MRLFKKNITKLSDAELLTEYKQSNAQKFVAELYSRYAHLVYGVSLKYLKNDPEAQDLTQDIYTILVKKLKTHTVTNFSSWLHQVTKNECLMLLRKNKRIELTPLGQEQMVEEDSLLEEKQLLEIKLETLLQQIELLKPEQKKCVKLFYLKKLSYKEIIAQTSFSEKEVKSYIQNGKRNLKNQLENHAEFRSEERTTRTA